jgi:HEAT repeat protein
MPVKIFFCYAHEDEALLNKLKAHLRPLQRQGLIDVWHDRDISAGTEWEQEISKHLNEAQIILLLVSPDFMNSDYCYSVEMKRAMERHEREEAYVISIILRPVYWQGATFAKLQALPSNAKPVKTWPDQDKALLNVAEGIRKVIEEIMGIAVPSAGLESPVVNQYVVDDLTNYLEKFVVRFSRLPGYYQSIDLPLDNIRQRVKVSRKRLQEDESRKRAATRLTEYARKEEDLYQQKIEMSYQWRGSELYNQQERYIVPRLNRDEKREQDESVVVDWDEIRMCVHRAVILGDPGFGKTWLLQYEGYRVAREQVTRLQENKEALDDIILPIHLRLSVLAEELVKEQRARGGVDVVEAIVNCVQQAYNLPARFLQFVRKCIPSAQCLLLLDALDEVKAEHRSTLIEALERWVEKEETLCRILLTSRIVGYQQAPFPHRKEKQEVEPELELVALDPEQVTHFIEQWFAGDGDRGKRLQETLHHDPMLRTLVRIPLLLTFFCLIGSKKRNLPIYRAKLYETVLRGLLEGSWREYDLQAQDAERLGKKLMMLEHIAWHFANAGGQWQDLLPGDEVIEVIERIPMKRRPKALSSKHSLLWEIIQRDGVLVSAGEASLTLGWTSVPYLFLHRTFHEFLVASYLTRLNSEEEMLRQVRLHCWFDSDWEEVIVLLAGCLKDPNPLLESLLAEPDDVFHYMLLLVARCLTEIDRTKVKPALADWIITGLVNLFQDSTLTWDRKQAVLILKQLRDSRVVDALLKAVMHDRNDDLRKLAIEALGQIDEPQAVEALQSVSQAKNEYVARMAMEVLERKGGSQARDMPSIEQQHDDEEICKSLAAALATDEVRTVEALQMDLQNRENISTYKLVVETLKKIGSPQAVDVLLQEFHALELDKNHWHWRKGGGITRRRRAIPPDQPPDQPPDKAAKNFYSNYLTIIKALEQIGTQQVIAGLLHMSKSHEVAGALSRIYNSQPLEALRAALHEEDWHFRWMAAQELAKRGDNQAIDVLLIALQHEDTGVRLTAIWALGKLHDPRATYGLIKAIQDQKEDHSVRQKAIGALGQQPVPEVVNILREALWDPEVSSAAAHALAEIHTPQAVEVLVVALQDQDADLRENATFALAEIGDPRAIEHLLAKLQEINEEDWEGRSFTIKTLAKLGNDPRIVKALLAELYGDERMEAAQALGQIGDTRVGEALLNALRIDMEIENEPRELLEPWRFTVVEALLNIGNLEEAGEALLLVMKDYDFVDDTFHIKRIVENMDDPCLIGVLVTLLKKWAFSYYNDEIVEIIERVLSRIGTPAVASLATVLRDKQEVLSVRGSAARVLGRIKDPKAVQALIEVLQEKNWRLCENVAFALRWAGGPYGSQAVLPLLDAAQRALDELEEMYLKEYENYRIQKLEDGYAEDEYANEEEYIHSAYEEYERKRRDDWAWDEDDDESERYKHYLLDNSVRALGELIQDYHDLPTFYDRLLTIWHSKALVDNYICNSIYENLLIRPCLRLRRVVGKDWPAWRAHLLAAIRNS